MSKIDSQVKIYTSEVKQKKNETEKNYSHELDKIESYKNKKKNEVNSIVIDEEEKLNKNMTPAFKSKGNDKLQSLEAKIKDLNNEIKKKDDKISSVRDELYDNKNNLESLKIEISKMKDNLSETSGILTIERSKAKMLSTQSTINAADKQSTRNINNCKNSEINKADNTLSFSNERV